jgi:hypothetical protein
MSRNIVFVLMYHRHKLLDPIQCLYATLQPKFKHTNINFQALVDPKS